MDQVSIEKAMDITKLNDLFLAAAKSGSTVEARRLLGSGANVNAVDAAGDTALHLTSIHMFYAELVKDLLESGALVDVQNAKGETPIHIASRKSNVLMVKILLDHGAKVNIQNCAGETPLHLAFNWGTSEISGLLIKNGAEINVQSIRGDTPLHLACRRGNCTLVNLLVENGALLNVPNFLSETPLHLATRYGNHTIANILLRKKALTDLQNDRGDTPLHIVARFNRKYCDKPTATELLNRGASVDIKNNDSKTPFNLAPTFSAIKAALREHVIKLKVISFPVNIDFDFTIDETLDCKFKDACVEELEKIASTGFGSDVSLYIVFSKKDQPYYLRDDERTKALVDTLYSPLFVEQFPIYAHVMRWTFERTKQRFDLLVSASQSLSHQCRLKRCRLLPDLVREKVLTQLSDGDLENFLESEER